MIPIQNQSHGMNIIQPDSSFGPSNYDWVYGGDSTFFSHFQSGAYRLQNGNTFVTVSQEKNIFEIYKQPNMTYSEARNKINQLPK